MACAQQGIYKKVTSVDQLMHGILGWEYKNFGRPREFGKSLIHGFGVALEFLRQGHEADIDFAVFAMKQSCDHKAIPTVIPLSAEDRHGFSTR